MEPLAAYSWECVTPCNAENDTALPERMFRQYGQGMGLVSNCPILVSTHSFLVLLFWIWLSLGASNGATWDTV